MRNSTLLEIVYGWYMENICYYFAKKWLNRHWSCQEAYIYGEKEDWRAYVDWMVSRTNWIIDEENNHK